MKKFLFFIIPILCLGTTCKKERPRPELYLAQEVKDYMYFKKDTWWIYTDTATGETEYLRVIKDTLYLSERLNDLGNKVIDKRESFQWYTNTERFSGYPLSSDTASSRITGAVTRSQYPVGANATYAFFYPFIDKSLQPNGLTVVSLYNTYDSLVILNKVYYDVVAFHETSNSMEKGFETIIYIGKHYGIIRKDILIEGTNGQPDKWKHWLLTDNEIIQ